MADAGAPWTEQRVLQYVQPMAECDEYAADVPLPFRPQVNALAWHEAPAEAYALCVTYSSYNDVPPLLCCELSGRFVSSACDSVIAKSTDSATRYNELDGAFFCRNVVRHFRRYCGAMAAHGDEAAARRRDISEAVQRRADAALRVRPYSLCAQKNGRRTMEDRHVAMPTMADYFEHVKSDIGLFAVFDGHGGADVANYAATHLPLRISSSALIDADPIGALKQAFDSIDKDIVHKCTKQKLRGGSTAVCCLLDTAALSVSWLGDSHCVLVGRSAARTLTKSHSPHDAGEHERVERAGGILMNVAGELRVQGVLNLTRSFGDIGAKPVIIAEPDVASESLSADHEMLVLACDGVYDSLDDATFHSVLYDFIQHNPVTAYGRISEAVVNKAKDAGSTDNVTCITVFLKPLHEIWPASQSD